MSKNINVKFDGVGCLIAALIIFFIMLLGGIKIVIHTEGNSEDEPSGLKKSRAETKSNQI